MDRSKLAVELHKNVPPDWYYRSIRRNPFQLWWHLSRFQEVRKVIEPVDGKILDIGCADGVFTQVIFNAAKPSEIIGIDVLKSSVDWARAHWKKNKKMKFKVGDIHKLDFKPGTFEAVFALEVMEHAEDFELALKEIKKVLKKNGYLVLLVPSDSCLFRVVWFMVKKFWWAKIWEDCHLQSFSSKNPLSKHVKKAGFKVEVDKNFWLGMLNLVKARKK